MLPYRRLFKYRMGRYRGSYEISSKYRLIIRYSIYRSIAIPSSIDIERSQVSRYFDISSIEPALTDIRPNHFKSALGGATYVYARLRFVAPSVDGADHGQTLTRL